MVARRGSKPSRECLETVLPLYASAGSFDSIAARFAAANSAQGDNN